MSAQQRFRKTLHLGTAYYPEHWKPEQWLNDIRLMQELGISVVRMGEFAWSSLEPSAGHFNFGWLDQAINLLALHDIRTVLGTPTAAPPAWLVTQHPEILATNEEGKKVQFGNRCHYCVNAEAFHEATARLVKAMAEHFGKNTNVIGWQIDNEFNRVCYCDHCQTLFQDFLSEKYQNLDELNRRWVTAYWSQTYSDWRQIPIPIGSHNPALMLEWKRFVTHSYRKFQKMQIDLIRPHLNEGVWITHNFMGWFDGLDHYEMSADLDMASWDWYVGMGHNDPVFSSATHDLTRGFKKKNFWVMETQPNTVNWAKINNSLYKGEARTMAWQAIGKGADAVLYWQWRSALNGQEQFHGTLIDQSGQPRPFFEEAKQIASEFKQLSSVFENTQVVSRAAILNDYESRWSISWQKHHKDFDYVAHLLAYYRPLCQLNIPVDIISPDQSLEGYNLVIAPALTIVDEKRVALLKDFVDRGGHLVLGARTAVKNRDNAFHPLRPPAFLSHLTGAEVEEFFALNEEISVKGNWFTGTARVWAERLKIIDTNFTLPIATYGTANGWLDNQVAITIHHHEAGLVYYAGTLLDDAGMFAFLKRVAINAGVNGLFETPTGVQVYRRIRTYDRKEVFVIVNHTQNEQTVKLDNNTYDDHISGKRIAGQIRLPPYGVAVLTITI